MFEKISFPTAEFFPRGLDDGTAFDENESIDESQTESGS
jgi:hypothetical protein